jgi:UPF0716 family protein affecting phage T7 exclusion
MPGSRQNYSWKRATLVALALAGTCVEIDAWKESGGLMAAATVEEALDQNAGQLMSVPGVVSVAVGECAGKPCIRVLVVRKTAELMQKIPSMLEGYPVVVEEAGPIGPVDRG